MSETIARIVFHDGTTDTHYFTRLKTAFEASRIHKRAKTPHAVEGRAKDGNWIAVDTYVPEAT